MQYEVKGETGNRKENCTGEDCEVKHDCGFCIWNLLISRMMIGQIYCESRG
jgi:hypothetical protein